MRGEHETREARLSGVLDLCGGLRLRRHSAHLLFKLVYRRTFLPESIGVLMLITLTRALWNFMLSCVVRNDGVSGKRTLYGMLTG